jgi:hypothetical protein
MIEPLADAMSTRLPLVVGSVEYADPVLTISGDEWSLSVVCPWRLTSSGELLAALGLEGADAAVEQLVGSELEMVDAKTDLKDPVFEFSGGRRLEVFADTNVDPWVMHLDDLVFVGMASDP